MRPEKDVCANSFMRYQKAKTTLSSNSGSCSLYAMLSPADEPDASIHVKLLKDKLSSFNLCDNMLPHSLLCQISFFLGGVLSTGGGNRFHRTDSVESWLRVWPIISKDIFPTYPATFIHTG